MPTKTVRRPSRKATARFRQQMDSSLANLTQAELIRRLLSEEAEYIFKHALVQESAQSSLLLHDRKRLHLQVAKSYERLFGANETEVPAAILAQHYAAAEDDANTLTYATRAGDAAAQVFAAREAITFYTLALNAANRGEPTSAQLSQLYTKLGRAYELTNEHDPALRLYEELERVARARNDRSLELQSLVLRGTILATYTSVFNPSAAEQLSDNALTLAQEMGDRTAEAKILWNLLLLNVFMQRQEQAIDYGERSLRLAREDNLTEQLPFTLVNLGSVLMTAGQLRRTQPMFQEARMLWREQNNVPMLADAAMMSALLAFWQGDFDQALAFSDESLALNREIGNVVGLLSSGGTLGGILLERGEMGDALELIQQNLRLAAQTHSGYFLTFINAHYAYVLGTLGAFALGVQAAQVALAGAGMAMPPFFRAWAHALLTLFYTAKGDLNAATQALTQVELDEPLVTISPAAIYGTIAQGNLALAQGNSGYVIERMPVFINAIRGFEAHIGLAEAQLLLAKALGAQGKLEEALVTLNQARTEAEPRQMRRVLWQILAELRDIEAERGNTSAAEEYRAQAVALLEYIAAHAPAEYRESFLNIPKVRKVMSNA